MGDNREVSAHLFVRGLVQGVGFRNFSQTRAVNLHLTGMVRNMSDGRVELKVSGRRQNIETLILELRKGPSRSRVDAVDVSWKDVSTPYNAFLITY